jgi:hypothetical protein
MPGGLSGDRVRVRDRVRKAEGQMGRGIAPLITFSSAPSFLCCISMADASAPGCLSIFFESGPHRSIASQ